MARGGERAKRGESPEQKRVDELFTVAYEELRRLASTVLGGDRSATLNPTALVNEAWVKLASSPRFAATSLLHFKRIAARAMRQVLIEAARRRNALKRGRGAPITITFDDARDEAARYAKDLLALDAALNELARIQPRQAMMVEGRFFGGLDIAQTAELLEVSEATIFREWRAARAWLAHQLHQANTTSLFRNQLPGANVDSKKMGSA